MLRRGMSKEAAKELEKESIKKLFLGMLLKKP